MCRQARNCCVDARNARHAAEGFALVHTATTRSVLGNQPRSRRQRALHVYRHFQKKRILSASYDAFWLACAGRLAADGLFDLPVVFIARESASLKANKRPMYKRRYAQLSDLAEQIKTRISLAQGARPVFHWHETLIASEPQPVAGLHTLPQRAVSAADKICDFDS